MFGQSVHNMDKKWPSSFKKKNQSFVDYISNQNNRQSIDMQSYWRHCYKARAYETISHCVEE